MCVYTDERAAFYGTLRHRTTDRTAKLVFADWLDENDEPTAAARLRWWAETQQKVRNGLRWDDEVSPVDVQSVLENMRSRCWTDVLCAIEILRIILDKSPLADEWSHVAKKIDDVVAVVERHALCIATHAELIAAESAAVEASAEAESAAWDAENREWNAPEKDACWDAHDAARASMWAAMEEPVTTITSMGEWREYASVVASILGVARECQKTAPD